MKMQSKSKKYKTARIGIYYNIPRKKRLEIIEMKRRKIYWFNISLRCRHIYELDSYGKLAKTHYFKLNAGLFVYINRHICLSRQYTYQHVCHVLNSISIRQKFLVKHYSFKLHTQKYSYHTLITLKHTLVTFKHILITIKHIFSDERVDTFYHDIIYLYALISSCKTFEEILAKSY